MNITQMQSKIQQLTDQINDIFHATQLNFGALKIHLHPQASKVSHSIFSQLKSSYSSRSNLRLEYLINQQIKSQQQKVRKQRLLQYEDKIYDHRRLVCDKQAFYDSMLLVKKRRTEGQTIEEFHEQRIIQEQNKQRGFYKQLQEQTQHLIKLEKVFRHHRQLLEDQLLKYQKLGLQNQVLPNQDQAQSIQNEIQPKQNKMQSIQNKGQDKDKLKFDQLQINIRAIQGKVQLKGQNQVNGQTKSLLNKNISLYQNYQISKVSLCSRQTVQQSKSLLSTIFQLSQSQSQLLRFYKQQKQMQKYLKWEQKDLIKKYKKIQKQIQQLKLQGNRSNSIVNKPHFVF